MSTQTTPTTINPLRRYIRENKLPHFFCAGCGCGQTLNLFLRAVDELDLNLDQVVAIGGVGCTARIPVYLRSVCLHGVHGRTLAWATGIKLTRPDLKVVIFAGDGDAASIGGNHLIHAARRNLDVTMVLVNNLNFAMTGGQVAPGTPPELVTMTTPYGNAEPQFDFCALAARAGATYVARWSPLQPKAMIRSLKKALQHKGFSLVEVISQCPTHFGRYALSSGRTETSLDWIKANTLRPSQAEKLSPEERASKFLLGEFVEIHKPVYRGTSVFRREECE